MIAQNCTILVIHVPKAAGTTLRWIIDRQYPQERIYKIRSDIVADVEKFRTLTEEQKSGLKVVFGHFWFGLHNALPPKQDYKYITILRDPAERVASLYYYARISGSHVVPGREDIRAHYLYEPSRNMSLAEFSTSGVTRTTDNAMVRQLCGEDRFTMVDERQQVYDDMLIPFGKVSRKHLRMAQDNIIADFALVGFTEQFDETIDRLKSRFAWRVPQYEIKNRTHGKPKSIPVRARMRIEDQNWLDRELYNWCLDRFVEGR